MISSLPSAMRPEGVQLLTMDLREFIRVLGTDRRGARSLSRDEAHAAFTSMLQGEGTDAQVAAFFVSLAWKGETVDEMVGFARAARDQAGLPDVTPGGLVAIGSPHDGKKHAPPLNAISGIIAAACGVPVLQVTDPAPASEGRMTSADVLMKLGAGWFESADACCHCIQTHGFGALSARSLLPSLDRLRRIRAEIGVKITLRTIEKLILPAGSIAVVGAHRGPNLGLAAEVLDQLDHPRAIVVQGVEGGVDPRASGVTRRIEVIEGKFIQSPIVPHDYGFDDACEPDVPTQDPDLVARVAEGVLRGEAGPSMTCAILGAAQLIQAMQERTSLAEAVDRARVAVSEGRAWEKLVSLRGGESSGRPQDN